MASTAGTLAGRGSARRTVAAILVALAIGVGGQWPAEAQSPEQPDDAQTPPERPSDAAQLLRTAESEGSVRVIVGLETGFTPEGRLSRTRIADQRDGIEEVGDELRGDLAGTGFRTVREYETVPYVALELSPRAFRALQRSPLAATITEDIAFAPTLATSTPIVQATTMWTRGHTGTGQTVAILDTGVDSTHPFLAGKVVEEACYSDESCPNGEDTQTGPGAGAPCMYTPSECEHGTHVAGIAAGQDAGMGFSGVARGANIMSVQVFSQQTGSPCEDEDGNAAADPCARSHMSDQIAALERVYAVRDIHDIASVNMSLGGGEYTEACDSEFPGMKAAMNNLFSEDIATVVSSGNDGHTNAVAAPACISTAVAVGSTTSTTAADGTVSDAVSGFSNSGAPVSFLAPGSGITSSIPGGGYGMKSGTSMAAPHVAGAFAILRQMNPESDILDITQRFLHGGVAVTDNRPGGTLTRKRISLADSFVFEVNSTDNVSSFGGYMDLPAGGQIWVDDGCDATECILYEAIAAANTMPNFGGPDVIEFDIPGSGVQTIELDRRPLDNTTDTTGNLPPILDPVVIDGFTQPGASANTLPFSSGNNAVPLIELSLTDQPTAGLVLLDDDSTVRGLVINRPVACCFNNGIAIRIDGSDNVVEGNFLGTSATGASTGAGAGFSQGVEVFPSAGDNTIGGTTPAARNVISGNVEGFRVRGSGTDIQGNYIGTNAAGTAAVANKSQGISVFCSQVSGCASNTTIGGAGAGNLISGNTISGGIDIDPGSGGEIRGNLIGTQRDGTSPLGNSGSGINVEGSNWAIGGLEPGQANTIAFNVNGHGVNVRGPHAANHRGDRNDISGNSIHSNGGLGINLTLDGSGTPNVNDDFHKDADLGPNEEQNYPVLTSASISGFDATLSGTLISNPSKTFRLEFFANAECDPSGFGEGQRYIGTTNVSTDANGDASFGPLSFRTPPGLPIITATATDPDGNTSEFSRCITSTGGNSPPTATDDEYSTPEGETLTIPDGATDLLANDTDPDGDPLTAIEVSDPANGTLTLDPDGSFTYTPNANFDGSDSFTYKANDGTADSNVATVEITVNAAAEADLAIEKNAPETVADEEEFDYDLTVANNGPSGAGSVIVTDELPDGVEFVEQGTDDRCDYDEGDRTVTCALGTMPPDDTTAVEIRVKAKTPGEVANTATVSGDATDPAPDNDADTATTTIEAANDPPTAANDAYATDEGAPLEVPAPGVLANDTDANNDTLTVATPRPTSGPTNGTLTLDEDGSFTYTPDDGFAGNDTFTYKATDGTAESDAATVAIAVGAVDGEAPDTTINSGPPNLTRSKFATFQFTSEPGVTFQCKLDGGAFTPCSSPKGYTNLPNGAHTFMVRATDAAGNTDPTPAEWRWTVDAAKPTISAPTPAPNSSTRSRTVGVGATVRDNHTNLAKGNIKLFVDRVERTNFTYNPASDRLAFTARNLALGGHTVRVVATDAAGNKAVRVWTFTVRRR